MSNILTQATRNAARSLVRNAPGYDAWRAGKGYDSELTKGRIFEAADALGLRGELDRLIAGQGAVTAADVADAAAVDAMEAGEPVDTVAADALAVDGAAVDGAAVQASIDGVLGTVRGFLAAGLVADIETRLRPLAVAANKPAMVVERIVEVAAMPQAPAGQAPYAKVVRQSTMSATFSVRTQGQAKLPVKIWDAVDAPKVDPAYVIEPARFAEVATALEHGETVWLAGAAGTGKGTLAREYAARTGRPFVRIGFTRATEIVDLLGQSEPAPHAAGGVEMIWRDKVFTQAIRRPGTVILLDEIMIAPAGTVAVFQTILDDRRVTLPTGEVVEFAPGVVVILADNSAGYGDESGVYAGVQPANAALVDRCGRVVIVDYLPAKLEALALHKHTTAPLDACQRLAEFAKVVRTAASKAGGEARPFSFRRLVAFMHAVHRDGLPLDTAWAVTALSRLPDADRETLRVAIGAHFQSEDFRRELNGEPTAAPEAPLSQAAEQVEARRVFAD